MNTVTTDVLVLGSGGAALRAAYEARQCGSDVLLVTKGVIGHCGATASGVAETGGFCAANSFTDPSDSAEVFYDDIIKAGRGMCNPVLSRILAERSAETHLEMEKLGVRFDRNESGAYIQKKSCFSTKPRMHMIQRHGMQIVEVLEQRIREAGVKIMEKTMAVEILVQDNRACGALVLTEKGEFLAISAKAVILGTGGAGNLFKINLNTPEMTGDGYALGYRAGAELSNIEFLQMGEAFVYPFRNIFHPWAWPLHPVILNAHGEEFIGKYIPENVDIDQLYDIRGTYYPFSCDKASFPIDVAIKKELVKGNGNEHDAVYFDYSKAGAGADDQGTELVNMWPHMNNWLLSKGIDVHKQKLEISLAFHAVNGGMRIDQNAQTTVDMLYAIGESASGPHGADRLGGSMLLACQVFGKIAGQNAAERTAKMERYEIAELTKQAVERHSSINNSGKEQIDECADLLRKAMWENVMICRDDASLRSNLDKIHSLSANSLYCRVGNTNELRKKIELDNMLLVGEIITQACLMRKESRGSHYREDFPKTNSEWNSQIVIRRSGDKPVLELDKPMY